MSVSLIDHWRTPSCAASCLPRRHDLDAHRAHDQAVGFRLGLIAATTAEAVRVVRTGRLVVDRGAQTASVDGQEIHLTPLDWRLLVCLAERLGRFLAIDQIVGRVWGAEYVCADGIYRTTGRGLDSYHHHMLRVRIVRLRARLGPAAYLVENRPGIGYRLRAEPPTVDGAP